MKLHSGAGHKDDVYTMLLKSSTPLESRVDFGPGMRHKAGKILRQLETGNKVLLLCQTSLPKKWVEELQEILLAENFDVSLHVLPDGEDAKSLEQLSACWALMQEKAFTRSDCVVAIGGGAVSDLAGFCASTYLRGVKLVLISTTLLGQVDASIGGKTAINLSSGKNLAGSFYFPHSVIVDPEYLATLPVRELKSGMGEITKYAFIEETVAKNTEYKAGPRPLWETLISNFKDGECDDMHVIAPLISCCIRMKLAVVLKDPFEQYLRRCLNLGHTLAHGLEKISNYEITHGEAVAIGTVFAFKLALSRKLIDESELAKVEQMMKSLKLPFDLPQNMDIDKLVNAIAYDKKRTGNSIKYVLPHDHAGKVTLDVAIPVEELATFIKQSFS